VARFRVVVTRETNNKCACPYMDGVFVRWVAATCLSNRSFAATCKKHRQRRLSQLSGGIHYATCSGEFSHIPLKFRPQRSDFFFFSFLSFLFFSFLLSCLCYCFCFFSASFKICFFYLYFIRIVFFFFFFVFHFFHFFYFFFVFSFLLRVALHSHINKRSTSSFCFMMLSIRFFSPSFQVGSFLFQIQLCLSPCLIIFQTLILGVVQL